jgi:hypothetical protein
VPEVIIDLNKRDGEDEYYIMELGKSIDHVSHNKVLELNLSNKLEEVVDE